MKWRAFGLLVSIGAGCTTEVEPSGGSAATGGAAAGGAPAESYACPEVTGLWPMVVVPLPQGGAFCIDSREVSNDQYAAFLERDAIPEPYEDCAAETDFTPRAGWPPAPERKPFPVGAVTWCEAYAFCSAAGKRLCGDESGDILGFDETVNQDDLGDTRTEMWIACTQNGAQKYAYGNEPQPGVCKDTVAPEDMAAAGAVTNCEGGYPGIFFLQGNAVEWEGACRFGLPSGEGLPNPFCLSRGFSGCESAAFVPGNETSPFDWHPQIGFRCCADAVPAD